jgi:signal transduction histidine kinase/ligand-binding sensor domain-containing protein
MYVGRHAIAACVWVLVCLGSAEKALALDPNLKLTQYVHRSWQTREGLSQTSIHAVTQTQDGYLWIGTQYGVLKFDGVRFTPVQQLERASLGEIWVDSFVQDSLGRVWMITHDSRLIRVSNDEVKVFTKADGMPTGKVSCLTKGIDGDLWVCEASDLLQFHGSQMQVHHSPEPLKSSRRMNSCQARDGTVWIAVGSGIVSWDGTRFARHHFSSLPPDADAVSVLCGKDALWIGTRYGLVLSRDGKEKVYTTKDGLVDNFIHALGQGSNGELWLGTGKGFSRFLNGRFESFTYEDGLSHNYVDAFYEDRESSLWVSTRHGLNQFVDGSSTRFTTREGLPSDKVGPVLVDHLGNVWVGFFDAGLAHFDGSHFTQVEGLASTRLIALMELPDGGILAGTDRGLYNLRDGKISELYTSEDGLPSKIVRSLFRDHSGRIWAGTEKGPAVLRDGRFFVPEALKKLADAPITAIGEMPDGRILVAADNLGLYVFDNGVVTQFQDTKSPISWPHQVTSIYTDKDGYVWIGSGYGLHLLHGDQTYHFLMTAGLFDSDIYGFLGGGSGGVWASSGKGFYEMKRQDLLQFAAGKIPRVITRPYNPSDFRAPLGVAGVQPVAGRDLRGNLWLSTDRGLLALKPDRDTPKAPPPPVIIEETTVNGERSGPTQLKQLGPGKTNLTFRYTALTLLEPQSLTFRYMLEGYDSDWTQAGTRREAFYTNLPSGKFRFRVSACALFVQCNDVGSSLELSVAPQIYQRTWFWFLSLAAVGLIAWMVHKSHIHRLRQQFAVRLSERSRIARELHDTLIQGFSGITLQMQALETQLRSPQKEILGEVIEDAGNCLVETRKFVAGLRGSGSISPGLAGAITHMVQQISLNRKTQLKLKLEDGEQEYSDEIKYNLVRIIQEAVSNSIKHSGADNIEVKMTPQGDEVEIIVSDDGQGISDRGNGASHTGHNGSGEAGHYGIVGMKERAKHIGADFELTSVPGRGTKVSVRIRKKENAASNRQEVARGDR